MKKGEFKPKKKELTKEELNKNRQQRKKELKKNRQQAERKDMFQIICQCKQVWGDLRRYMNNLYSQKIISFHVQTKILWQKTHIYISSKKAEPG